MATMMLKNDDQTSLRRIAEFYFKRIRRLVPIYLLSIIFIWTANHFLVYPLDNVRLAEDIKWASAFATNIHETKQPTGYFALVSD